MCLRYCRTRPLPSWIQLWLLLSSAICAFDVFFTMYRPRTLHKGDLAYLTKPWRLYAEYDLRYQYENDIVTCATGRVMIVEIVLNIVAVVLRIFLMKNGFLLAGGNLPGSRMCSYIETHSVVIAFTTSCFVFWKTLWYMVMYIEPPDGSVDYLVDDFSWQTILIFWVADGVWVVIPLIVMLRLWPKLVPRDDYDALKQNDEDFSKVPNFYASLENQRYSAIDNSNNAAAETNSNQQQRFSHVIAGGTM